MLIGLTSTIAAGKDTVADYLAEKYDFTRFSLSDVIRKTLEKRGIMEHPRSILAEEGNKLRKANGPGFLGAKALDYLKEIENAVVVSIRNPSEAAALKEGRADFVLVGIDAPFEKRFEWAKKRGRVGDSASAEEFRTQEEKEFRGDEHGQQVLECFEMRDETIVNDGSLDDLYNKVDKLLEKLK